MARLKILSEIRGVLTGLAVVGVGLMLAISINLDIPGQELLTSLRFHVVVLMVVVLVALIMAGARLRALVLFGLIALSAGQGAAIVMAQQAVRGNLQALTPNASFTALSFNVLGDNLTGADAAHYIATSDADVVVLMEGGGIEAGFEEVAAAYPYRLGCEPDIGCDTAILSRTPFTASNKNLRRIDATGLSRLMQVTTVIDGQSVNIVAMHLTKPYFDDASVFELSRAERLISRIEGPVLLMGDFNAAAWSDRAARFVSALQLVPPPNYPGTWPVELGPVGVPIDNVFTRGQAMVREIAATPGAFGSNHLGLKAIVDLY